MQDAYYVDQQSIGDWKAIGYEEPTSKTFKYEEGGESAEWQATAQFDVPDGCGKVWSVNVIEAGTKASYQASDNCAPLTPNFKNIGTSGTGS